MSMPAPWGGALIICRYIRRISQGTFQEIRAKEQVFSTGGRTFNVNSREGATLLQSAGKVQFHVAGALKFLIDDIVQTGAGIDQRRGDDRKAAASFQVPGSAEKAFRRIKGRGVQTTG